jgi:type IV fimbrial biogenesis protein FimT
MTAQAPTQALIGGPPSGGRQGGLTVVELALTLAVVAILLAVGVPNLSTLILDNRRTATINDLVTDMMLARSEAMKRGVVTSVCKANATLGACDNTADWQDGWLVFTDLDNDGAFADDGDATPCEDDEECVLRVHGPLTLRAAIAFSRSRVAFDTRGFAAGFGGTFVFCDRRGASHARGRVLSSTGRLRATVDTDADGVHEDGTGTALTCPSV